MIPAWLSVVILLTPVVTEASNDTQPCAKVQTSSLVVPLGSPVSASCVIGDNCPLVLQQDDAIEWQLDQYTLPSSPSTGEGGRVSKVFIPSFNLSRAFLICSIQGQVVGGVEIRAGYPPETPQNLSCQTNLSNPNTLNCSWDPGQSDTFLPTSYSLHTILDDKNNPNHTYNVSSGQNHYVIPRNGFILYFDMEIYVKAVNQLGEATSLPITLEPVSAAKLDPPVIMEIQAKDSGCLSLRWNLSPQQSWLLNPLINLELRVKTADSRQWFSKPVNTTLFREIRQIKLVQQCRLLHGTEYLVQLRVRYKESPWSEWSYSQSAVTLESAPSGNLEWWMKSSVDHVTKRVNIHLLWKASKQFRANSQNISYEVSGENQRICFTGWSNCSFHLSSRTAKLYLRAVNAAGKSKPTEVHIPILKVHSALSNVTATPHDDRSLMVRWRSVVSSALKGFIVEWRPLLNTDMSLTQFEIVDSNQTSLILKGSFEPYKPYEISVYPRFKTGIGLPQTVIAYIRQKAPSKVPPMQISKTWRSNIELSWNEIPIDQRNGIIQSYKVFYWKEKGPINVVTADLQKRSVFLKNLDSDIVYESFLMVSTYGGSLNGSRINFEVEPFDVVAVILVTLCCGLTTVFVIIMMCFSKYRWIKVHFWPVVPDPANSSIKRWSSDSTQDTEITLEKEKPNLVCLSHLSFLDIPLKLSKEDEDVWLSNTENTSDLGESICGSLNTPQFSIPYATLVFSSPCNSPTTTTPPVYLRSESTQPLLATEVSSSPQYYQNINNDNVSEKQCFFGPCSDFGKDEADTVIQWDDFPFLRALEMNQIEN